MSIRTLGWCAGLVAASMGACDRTSAQPDTSNTVGVYHRDIPAPADLRITGDGNVLKIEMDGAATLDGAATAADCAINAEGRIIDSTIFAHLVPYHRGGYAVSDDDLKSMETSVRLIVVPDGIRAEKVPVNSICGIGSDLTGMYAKLAEPPER